MRITIKFGAWSSGGTLKCYVARAATTTESDVDFVNTPSQIQWSGSGTLNSDGVTLTFVSDLTTLPETYNEASDYLFAFYETGAATVTIRYSSPVGTPPQVFYLAGDDAATVNKGAYSSYFQRRFFISKIEIGS